MHILFGGDVMLGRLVKQQIHKFGIDYPMGKISPIMHRSDVKIINLECAITTYSHHWSGAPKAFYFGAPPEAADILANLKVDLASLANNHLLDFNYQGLIDTLYYLNQKKIKYVGAGNNISAALKPAIFKKNNINFGMAAYCDHQKDFAATENSPGIAYLDLNNTEQALTQIHNSLIAMKKQDVDWPILSLHWGPNMVDRPSQKFIQIAHAVIDMGYKTLFGHSAHVFHGIEIYKGFPIIYAAGDLVDDYAVDPYFRNDHQLLFEIEIVEKKLQRVFLYPVFIDFCQVKPANKEQFEYIADRTKRLCAEIGTTVQTINYKYLMIKCR